MKNDALFSQSHEATYCPEDDKLRLYVGRVPRAEYDALRNEGWQATAKQDCDFSAVWTPEREDTALSYAGVIGDEDQSPQDRAADRAERFAGYRDKRTSEALDHADRYDSGPGVHGFQSQEKADRSAARHDRIGTRAVNAWDKADYWTHRTAGVIDHALYKSRPDVRMGRIKTLEAELRKAEKTLKDWQVEYSRWEKIRDLADAGKQNDNAKCYAGMTGGYNFTHPRAENHPREYFRTNKTSLYTLLTDDQDPITGAEACALFFARHKAPVSLEEGTRTIRHLRMRLAYENQMLEAQGGRAAHIEMEAGGTLGKFLITRVYKSTATGRVTSVDVLCKTDPGKNSWGFKPVKGTGYYTTKIETERMGADAYKAPTEESRAELAELTKAKKQAAKEAPKGVSMINPTDADAERLQEIWNERARADYARRNGSDIRFVPATVVWITQAVYSANSKGSYAKASAKPLHALGVTYSIHSSRAHGEVFLRKHGPALVKVRVAPSPSFDSGDRVVVLTDKPQKKLPEALFSAAPGVPTYGSMLPRLAEVHALMGQATANRWGFEPTSEQKALLVDAIVVGFIKHHNGYHWTEEGYAAAKELGLFSSAQNVNA